MRRRISLALFFLPLLALGPGSGLVADDARADGRTAFLAGYYAVKAAAPLGLVLNAAASDGNFAPGGALAAAWTLPSSMVLASLAREDASSLRFWRGLGFGVDGLAFLGLAGLGIYTLLQPSSGGENWGGLIGALSLAFSLPFGGAAALDLIPFPLEGRAARGAP